MFLHPDIVFLIWQEFFQLYFCDFLNIAYIMNCFKKLNTGIQSKNSAGSKDKESLSLLLYFSVQENLIKISSSASSYISR